jgi:hypothetical protein
MAETSSPALTPEQWESRDYRQAAREIDDWAKSRPGAARETDSTEYVAKVGVDQSGSVIVMNRAHDRVLVPPPVRPVLAAFALVDQPFGFTAADIDALERAAARVGDEALAGTLRNMSARVQALLPPKQPA